jgi:hypothetical protein
VINLTGPAASGQLSYDWKPEGLIIRFSVPVERLTM